MSDAVTLVISEAREDVLRLEEISPEQTLELTRVVLTCSATRKPLARPLTLPLADCIGASSEGRELVVSSAPLKGAFLAKPCRQLKSKRFACVSAEQATSWSAAIQNLLRGASLDAPLPSQRPRWLVVINPVSGNRLGLKVMDSCRPLFEAAGIALNEVITTHQGHAGEVIAQLNIAAVDGVVCVGGDGIVYEVVNALMSRPDADELVASLPIGVLPAGTGNSLSCSLLHAAKEPLHHMR